MKCIAFVVALMIMATSTSVAQDEASQKAWMEYMTPGDMHKMLAKEDGEWNEEVTMYNPNGETTTFKATVTNSMILGGRYQVNKHVGDFNGMPFEGIGTTAYDNSRKVFINSWIDNMGSGMMVLEGTWDPATKTIVYRGKTNDPATGKEIKVRHVVKYIDDNTQHIEMYDERGGTEAKSMEIKLTRK